MARWVRVRRRLGWGLALVVGLVLAREAGLRLTPFPAELLAPRPASTEFLARDRQPLRLMLAEERRYSRPVELAELGPWVVPATLSAEDKRFYRHGGVDGWATLRALAGPWAHGRPVQGASTITQQLVKLACPGSRTLGRKLQEAWLAWRVERSWGKERILAEYLNRLEYGNLQVGVGAAAHYYFGVAPEQLSPAQAALLAGLPKAPSRLNPHRDFAAAHARQQWVLRRMAAGGRLSAEAAERALREPLTLAAPRTAFAAPHLVDLLLHRQGVLPKQGGRVVTSVDLALQEFAEAALARNLRLLVDKHATNGAVVVLQHATGEVLALAGAGDYFTSRDGQVNGAWTVRSPGSAVKPFTYLLALQQGAEPCTVVPDVATTFPTETGLYRPNNYNHRFYGPVSLRFALGNSLNIGALRALELAGGPAALQHGLQQVGITTLDHPPEYYGLGLTLGNGEVRLLELVNAYAALGRLGAYQPFRLLKAEGAVQAPSRQVWDKRAAYLVADMLADPSARTASFGLSSYLSFDFPVACKTGTSSDYRDNWCMGYTPEFTVGVWVGNADGSPMREITGVTGAAPVMHEVMTYLHRSRGTSWFAQPEGLVRATVDPLTGRLAPEGARGAVAEWCQHRPEVARAEDYDGQGRVRLPAEYREWLAGPQNGLGSLVAPAEVGSGWAIRAPAPGSVYFLDGDVPAERQRIALQAEGGEGVEWRCATLAISGGQATLRTGRHELVARDPVTGREAATWIEVRAW